MARDKQHGVGWTERSSEILVDTAVNLEFLHKDYHWAAKGHVINIVGASYLGLQLSDRIAYLKYFLEGDGGALIHLLKIVVEQGEIERASFLSDEKKGWENVVKSMCREYLSYPLDIEQKYRIREILKFAEREGGYGRHTREHKLNPRTELLVDLGILIRTGDPNVRYLPAKINEDNAVHRFNNLFGDLSSLETILSKKGDYYARAAELYGMKVKKVDTSKDFHIVATNIVQAYDKVKDDTFRLAHLDAIRDIVCIKMLCDRKKICEWQDVDSVIHLMKQESDKDIHYHVNDWGVISYVTMNKDYMAQMIHSGQDS